MKAVGRRQRVVAVASRFRTNEKPLDGAHSDALSAKATRFLGSAPVIEAINRKLRGDELDLSGLTQEDMVAFVEWLAKQEVSK